MTQQYFLFMVGKERKKNEESLDDQMKRNRRLIICSSKEKNPENRAYFYKIRNFDE